MMLLLARFVTSEIQDDRVLNLTPITSTQHMQVPNFSKAVQVTYTPLMG